MTEKFYNTININILNNKFEHDFYSSALDKNLKLRECFNNYSTGNISNLKLMILNKFKNYKYLCSFNYTIDELKLHLKNNKIKVTGKKVELYKRLYFYMYLMYSCIYIQKNYRNLLCSRLNELHGPAKIQRNLCVNDTDFYTLDDIKSIHYDEFYSFKDESNFIYGFNIKSIYNLIKNGKCQNPYNLKELSPNIVNNISKFIKFSDILNIKLNLKLEELQNMSYDKRLNDIFHEIDLLGNYTNPLWFKNLSFRRKIVFLKELHDIWIYRANIDNSVRLEIYPYGDPFLNLNLNNIYNNVPLDNFNNICLNIIENFIKYGNSDSSKSLGALYILSALTIVSIDAAEAMPWLYESVSYTNM